MIPSLTDVTHRCPACERDFLSLSGLLAHNRSKHGAERPLLIACTLCERVFYDVVAQVQHLRSSHGVELLRPSLPIRRFYQVQPGVSKSMAAFAQRHGMVCYWCDGQVLLDVPDNHAFAPTREHLLPRAHGGRATPENLVLAHKRCNSRRGTIAAEAFRRLMRGEALTVKEMWPE